MSGAVLILTRREIAALMTPADYRGAVEAAFRAAKEGRAAAPPPLHIAGEGGQFHGKAASIEDGGKFHVALKLNGNFPGNPAKGLPTIQGGVLFCDGRDGRLLAVMDSIEITLGRTAGASALAATHLARAEAQTLFIAGCGDQALAHAAAMADVRRFTRGLAFDLDGEKAARFAAAMQKALGFDFRPAAALADAARADVIVTLTTATAPFLGPSHVSPGAFVAAVGADNPEKSEIAPDLMASATVVVDVLEQCLVMGDLRAAIAAGAMTAADVHADLGDIVTGKKPGRRDAGEIIVFDSTGTGLEDVAAAALAYERALNARAGSMIALGAA